MEIKNKRILIISSTFLLLYVFVTYCFNNSLNFGLNNLIPSLNFNSISTVGKLFDFAGKIRSVKSTFDSNNSIINYFNSNSNKKDKSDPVISVPNNVTDINSKFNEIEGQVSAASSKADDVKSELNKISNQTQEAFIEVGRTLGKIQAELKIIENNSAHSYEAKEQNNSKRKDAKVDNTAEVRAYSITSKPTELTQVNSNQVLSKDESLTVNNLNIKISDLNKDLIKNFDTIKNSKASITTNIIDDNSKKILIYNQLPKSILKNTQESEPSSRQFIDDKQWIVNKNNRLRIENALYAFNKNSSRTLSVLIFDSINEMNSKTADINLNNRIYIVIVNESGLRIKFLNDKQYTNVLTKKITNEIITRDMFPDIHKGDRAAGIINAINQIEILFKNTNIQNLNYQSSKVDNIPVCIKQVHPQYPKEMINSKIKGEVVVDFIADRKGDVANAFVVKSTNSAFDQAAIDAIFQWKFRPATKNGINVDMHLQVPVLFDPNNLE